MFCTEACGASRGRVRIGTELSDTETGTIIRSDQYDGRLAELFELQDRISANVLKTIAPNVQERELLRTLTQASAEYDSL
jgi:TolB-like protein